MNISFIAILSLIAHTSANTWGAGLPGWGVNPAAFPWSGVQDRPTVASFSDVENPNGNSGRGIPKAYAKAYADAFAALAPLPNASLPFDLPTAPPPTPATIVAPKAILIGPSQNAAFGATTGGIIVKGVTMIGPSRAGERTSAGGIVLDWIQIPGPIFEPCDGNC